MPSDAKFNFFSDQVKDLVLFVLGLCICIEIKFVGIFNLTEILLLPASILFLKNRKFNTFQSRLLIFLGFLWLIGQLVTDLYRVTPIYDALRGSANIILFLTNFFALYILCYRKFKRFILFITGVLLSQVIDFYFAPNLYVESQPWKFGFGNWINIFGLFIIGSIAVQYKSKLRFGILLFLVISLVFVNFYLGARAYALILCLSVFILILPIKNVREINSNYKRLYTRQYSNLFLGSTIGIVLIFSAYGFVASNGYLGEDAESKYVQQSSGSLGILVGGRQELLVSSLAIYDSPILGHGSWAKDEQYSELLGIFLEDFDYNVSPITYRDDDYGLIPTHSYLFGAWVYSGILGAIFWGYVFVITVRGIVRALQIESQYKVAIVYTLLSLLWNILFSPLGLYSRVYAAIFIVVTLSTLSVQDSLTKYHRRKILEGN